MGFRVFVPSSPRSGCGRTTSTTFQELARATLGLHHASMPQWKRRYPGARGLNVARHGHGHRHGPRRKQARGRPSGHFAPRHGRGHRLRRFSSDGKKVATLRGATMAADFKRW